MAKASAVQEFQKHCYVSLDSTKRKLEYSDYGGKTQALEVANHFLTRGKAIRIEFDMLRGSPLERKEWIIKHFGEDALQVRKSLAVQRSMLVYRLCSRQVPSFEAAMMQVAVRSTPGLTKKDALVLTYERETDRFKAIMSGGSENMSKTFADIKAARDWLLNIGKSSEAREV